ncbi:hypothetical protein ACVIW0_006831 [Bradyrhizobium sp. USDA 4454]
MMLRDSVTRRQSVAYRSPCNPGHALSRDADAGSRHDDTLLRHVRAMGTNGLQLVDFFALCGL